MNLCRSDPELVEGQVCFVGLAIGIGARWWPGRFLQPELESGPEPGPQYFAQEATDRCWQTHNTIRGNGICLPPLRVAAAPGLVDAQSTKVGRFYPLHFQIDNHVGHRQFRQVQISGQRILAQQQANTVAVHHAGTQGTQEAPNLHPARRHVGYGPKAINHHNPKVGFL